MTAQFPTDSPQFSIQQPVQLHFFSTFPLSQTRQVSALKPQLHTRVNIPKSQHGKTDIKLKTTPHTFNLIPNTPGNFYFRYQLIMYASSDPHKQATSYQHSSFYLHTDIETWEMKKNYQY
jgi:hypothetical protein